MLYYFLKLICVRRCSNCSCCLQYRSTSTCNRSSIQLLHCSERRYIQSSQSVYACFCYTYVKPISESLLLSFHGSFCSLLFVPCI